MSELPQPGKLQMIVQLDKSPNDSRDYEVVILANQLKVLLIHDSTAEKSACSISVGVGSLEDPPSALGLAHFLQHMLFMGSAKFPVHNEYSAFISANAGSDNAYTSDEETNYYFRLANRVLQQGVQRMANFFLHALLIEDCIAKERQAVHEQYMLQTNDDNCRKWQIIKLFASGPYHQFSVGCQETLSAENIREELVRFYQEKYSADRMNAVLLSSFSIEDMKELMLPFLKEIPNKHTQKLIYEPHFEHKNLGHFLQMQSIKDEYLMQFFWIVQNLRPYSHNHPSEYITHVLGHEGTNSLLSHLKLLDYASELTSYSSQLPRQTIIGLQVHLTDSGEDHYNEVYNIVMDYTSWLRADQQIYRQLRQIAQVNFKFYEKKENDSYVTQLSSLMHRKPIQELLTHTAIFAEFNKPLLDQVIGQLNAFNLIVIFSNNEKIENAEVEKYLGAKYAIQPLPERVPSSLSFNKLNVNEYLPIDITVHPVVELNSEDQNMNHPYQIGNIMFLPDRQFRVCRGSVKLTVFGAQDTVFREFYTSYLEMLLKESIYNAEMLQVDIDIQDDDALIISMFGFNDTISKLLVNIGGQILSAHKSKVGKAFFKLALDNMLEEYENFYEDQLDEIASRLLDDMLKEKNVSVQETLEMLDKYRYASLAQRIQTFWGKCTFQWIFMGNFKQAEAISLAKNFQLQISSAGSTLEEQCRYLVVTDNVKLARVLKSEEIGTSASIVYYQAGPYSERLYYTLFLAKEYIKQPFFNSLRTEKQLAYYLSAYTQQTFGCLGLCFILISSVIDAERIAITIKQFISEFIRSAKTNLTNEKMQELRESLISETIAPHNSLKDHFEFVCRECKKKTYNFSRKDRKQIEKWANSIEKQDIIGLLERITQTSLDVLVFAKKDQQAFERVFKTAAQSIAKIKQTGHYHYNQPVL